MRKWSLLWEDRADIHQKYVIGLSGWFGDRGPARLIQVVELAPDMRPAGHFDDGAGFIEPVETGKAIGLQRSVEVLEMIPWMLTFAVRRVGNQTAGAHRDVGRLIREESEVVEI